MNELYSSDKPITHRSDDKFQRYEFSKRIAETIMGRNDNNGITIGLYGAWGEGKSSVLNFIQNELKKDEDVLTLNFNPWRYSDEDSLLRNFLKKLSQLIDKEIETKKEKFGHFIKKYGSISSFFGYDLSKIGEALSDVDLEVLKDRMNEFIKEGKNKLVIIIDDIDRLDKNEIFALFRLIKLTGDFDKTTYILSFDEKMVANAIGERFGEGNAESGHNFLEKIIQVPLKIPQAQPIDLQKFCFNLLNNAIEDNNILLQEDEVQIFSTQFIYNVLPVLKTPRLAIRYVNSLAFSFPLLRGEVNMVDLMLIEAIKIFYPEHYEFIKNNSIYFISSYSSDYVYNRTEIEERKKELNEHLEKLSFGLNKIENKAIKDLIEHLFPRVIEAFYNSFQHDGAKKWMKEKRIGSANYFKRYFSYSVLDGEISDVDFDALLNIIKNEKVQTVEQNIKEFIDKTNVNEFIYKLRLYENELTWESSKKIIISLCSISSRFSDSVDLLTFGIATELNQVALFVYNLLKNHKIEEDIFEFSKLLMSIKPYSFAYRLNNTLRTGRSNEDKLFSSKEYSELASLLRKNLLEECGDEPIYKNNNGSLSYILKTWHEENRTEFNEYFEPIFNDVENIKEFLINVTPMAQSTNEPEPYKSNFSKEHYELLESMFDVEKFYLEIMKHFSTEVNKEAVKFYDFENKQTEINIIRQFIYWHDIENKETSENK